MNHHPPRYYSSEQVSRIIRNALKIKEDEGISHRELMETGKELGLDESTLAAAIKAEERESVRYRSHQRRKTGFHWHLYSYLVVNLALFVVNALVPGPWWFQWSVLGWGIGLAFHFKAVYSPSAVRNRT